MTTPLSSSSRRVALSAPVHTSDRTAVRRTKARCAAISSHPAAPAIATTAKTAIPTPTRDPPYRCSLMARGR